MAGEFDGDASHGQDFAVINQGTQTVTRYLATADGFVEGETFDTGAGPTSFATADFNGFDVANASVPTQAIQCGGPPKDGIPSIDRPKFVRAGQARLADNDRVLGLTRNGRARAYPVRILNWHEVVNDRFGGRAVVVTYCPLCGTGMAFEGQLGSSSNVAMPRNLHGPD